MNPKTVISFWIGINVWYAIIIPAIVILTNDILLACIVGVAMVAFNILEYRFYLSTKKEWEEEEMYSARNYIIRKLGEPEPLETINVTIPIN